MREPLVLCTKINNERHSQLRNYRTKTKARHHDIIVVSADGNNIAEVQTKLSDECLLRIRIQ